MAAMRTEAVDEVAGWRAHRSPEEAHTPPSRGLRGGNRTYWELHTHLRDLHPRRADMGTSGRDP